MLIQNTGRGDARNLKLTSAQPKIVENEKGFLINFRITQSAVDGLSAKPSLAMDFGDLAPGTTKVGVLTLESSLQGLFTDYDATFEHLDGQGDPRLSLLKSVEIHEMNRLVEAGGVYADGLPDFLCNDVPDSNDFPDTLYLSDGAQLPVTLITAAGVSGQISESQFQVQLTATMPGGWGYLRLPDPGHGQYRLIAVTRQDGAAIPVGKNVWQTDRTFIGLGQRPRYENMLHLLDVGGTGSYTLTYASVAPDLQPPVSRINPLPGNSPDQFALTWSGTDDSGIRYYDIFVRENGEAWTLWKSAVAATAAVFEGSQGSTYGFYCVATDASGNRETKAAAAETTTFVDGTNGAPILTSVPPRQVTEGQLLKFLVEAVDSNLPLTYRLTETAPGGASISSGGVVQWIPTEVDGGTTRVLTVAVTDSGLPQKTSLLDVEVTIVEDNMPPVIEPVETQQVTAGETKLSLLRATDADSPAQTLSWSLMPESSPGMSLEAGSGLLIFNSPYSRTSGVALARVAVTDSGIPAQTTLLDVNFLVAPGNASNRPPQPVALTVRELVYLKGTADAEVALTELFTDADAADDIQAYAVLSNSHPEIVTETAVLSLQHKLLLALNPEAHGTSLLTLEAVDRAGLKAQTALRIRIVEDGDDDGDGLRNDEEYLAHTDPANPDSDGDGYRDGTEAALGSDPALASSNLAVYFIAENDALAALTGVPVKRLTKGVMKNSVAGGASTAIEQAWLGTYEFTNRQWAAVLQYALKQMPGTLAITGTGADAEVRQGGLLVCKLPTHLASDTATGGLTADEVALDPRSLTFYIPLTIAEHPARGITWYGAYLATRVLNAVNGYPDKCLPGTWSYDFTKPGYYLPRDTEWEWAARGGAASLVYPTGAAVPTVSLANFNAAAETGAPKKTGGYKANALGLFDLAGNVAEWMFDSHSTDPQLGWIRGGAWPDAATALRNNTRAAVPRLGLSPTVGFRVALADERKPAISAPLASLLVMTGQPLEMAVSATGTPPLMYQWSKNGAVMAGKTQSKLRLSHASLADAGAYTVKVTNALGTVTSAAASVGVVDTAAMTLSAPLRGKAVFPARAAGTGLLYQWRDSHGNLVELASKRTGTTKASLTVASLTNDDSGPYTCFVTGPGATGSILSGAATLTVLSIPVMETPAAAVISGVVSGTVQVPFKASGSPAKFIVANLPAGMTFDPATGRLGGKPTKAGTYKIKVSASNAAGTSGIVEITLNVADLPATLKGNYIGLVTRDPATNASLGARVEMAVTGTGAATGKLFIGATGYPFAGPLDAILDSTGNVLPPTATFTVARKNLPPVALQMTLGLNDDSVTGYVSASGGTALLNGYRIVWSASHPATAYAGANTASLALDAGQTDAGIPQGMGYQTLTVASSGKGQWVGRLADGTTTTYSSVIGPAGEVLYYLPLYSGRGSLTGTATFAPDSANPGRRLLSSPDWTWTKTGPPAKGDRYYPNGFGVPDAVSLVLDGGTYIKPVGQVPVLTFGAGSPNAILNFSGGGIADWQQPLTWPAANVPKLPAKGNPNAVKLTFKAATGVVTGEFKITETVNGKPYIRTAVCSAVIIQRLSHGIGYFLLPELPNATAPIPVTPANATYQSGSMLLTPAP